MAEHDVRLVRLGKGFLLLAVEPDVQRRNGFIQMLQFGRSYDRRRNTGKKMNYFQGIASEYTGSLDRVIGKGTSR